MSISGPVKKLSDRAAAIKSCLCVGLDSEYSKLPPEFLATDHPQLEFNKWIIDQTHAYAAAYKINTAFYEARGDEGWREIALTQTYLKENHPDIFTIVDAKRADIGNTNAGYVTAFFDELVFDAITLHPYLGKEALQPFLDRKDKVSIILCKTSNPGSGELQDLQVEGQPLWKVVAKKVATQWNDNQNCMVVAGATYPELLAQIRAEIGDMWMLVPGVGEQGGDAKAVLEKGTTLNGDGVLINISRAIIFNENPGKVAKSFTIGL